jgi:hypothetical protein
MPCRVSRRSPVVIEPRLWDLQKTVRSAPGSAERNKVSSLFVYTLVFSSASTVSFFAIAARGVCRQRSRWVDALRFPRRLTRMWNLDIRSCGGSAPSFPAVWQRRSGQDNSPPLQNPSAKVSLTKYPESRLPGDFLPSLLANTFPNHRFVDSLAISISASSDLQLSLTNVCRRWTWTKFSR